MLGTISAAQAGRVGSTLQDVDACVNYVGYNLVGGVSVCVCVCVCVCNGSVYGMYH